MSQLNSQTKLNGAMTSSPTPVNTMDTNQLVRMNLIHENWKLIESKKSRMFSTMFQCSTKSLVPPSLPLDGKPLETEFKADDDIIVTKRSNNDVATRQPQLFDYNRHLGLKNGIFDKLNGTSHPAHKNVVDQSANVRFKSSYRSPSESRDSTVDDVDFIGNHDDDDDVDAEILSSITTRKMRHKSFPDSLNFADDDQTAENNTTSVDVDTLCVTPKVDDINVALFRRWGDQSLKRPDDVSRQSATTGVVPTYENLICLQRDLNRPLYMYIPTAMGRDKPSVGDM